MFSVKLSEYQMYV